MTDSRKPQFFNTKPAKTLEEFWDNQSALPNFQGVVIDDENSTATRMLYNFISTQIDFAEKKVLDVGCGVGRLFPIILDNGATQVHGVDFSLGMLRVARFKFPQNNVLLYKLDASSMLQLGDNVFDVVMVNNVLAHIIDNMTCKSAINEVMRVTKEGGHIFICELMSLTFTKYYDHSKLKTRPLSEYLDTINSHKVEMMYCGREAFGLPQHIDSYRWVIFMKKIG